MSVKKKLDENSHANGIRQQLNLFTNEKNYFNNSFPCHDGGNCIWPKSYTNCKRQRS